MLQLFYKVWFTVCTQNKRASGRETQTREGQRVLTVRATYCRYCLECFCEKFLTVENKKSFPLCYAAFPLNTNEKPMPFVT